MRAALAALMLAGTACGARTDLGGPHGGGGAGGDGGCVPEIVARDPKGASALALDGDVVFWGTQDGFVRTRDATGATTTIASEASTIASLAVDAQYVYYAITGSIRRVPRGGGAPADFVSGAGQPFALDVSSSPTLGAGAVYWIDYGAGIAAGSVHASGANGGSDLVVPGLDTPGGMTADENYVYVTAALADVEGLVYQSPLFRIDKAGHARSVLVDQLHDPAAVVVYDGRAYYIEQTGPSGDLHGGVRSIPIASGTPETVLHTDETLPLDLAVDASGVYATVLDGSTGALVRPDDNEEPVALASTPGVQYAAVRTSPTAIYWTIQWTGGPPPDGASVRKLCK